jgi:hypothetical protein
LSAALFVQPGKPHREGERAPCAHHAALN